MTDAAATLAPLVARLFGGELPLRLVAWDGSTAGPDALDLRDGPAPVPTVEVRSPDALLRLATAPGELGLARAYVAGDIALGEGTSIFDLLALRDLLREGDGARHGVRSAGLGLRDVPAVLAAARDLGVRPHLAPAPATEARTAGRIHSRRRDAAAVRHHYDVGNDFYRLVLGPSMTYSCAYWDEPVARGERGGAGGDDAEGALAAAQEAKHELVCRKLALGEGVRVLDVGCGWGSFLIHAAHHHGAVGVGVTLSAAQAALARRRVREAGVADRVQIRVEDYRDLRDRPFAAIASVGMFEHVGHRQEAAYAAILHGLLAPGGRLLNHAISRPGPTRRSTAIAPRSFMGRYVFPDAALHEVGHVVTTLQGGGLEVRDVESLREHYGRTLRVWVANLERHWAAAQRAAGPERARVWRLYLAGSALGFEAGRLSVHQVLAVRPHPDGRSGMPARRDWTVSGAGRAVGDVPSEP